jgi:DNA polymerase-3 subunit delta'
LQSPAQDAKFQLFFDLYQATLARLIGEQAKGQGQQGEATLAHRLIGPDRLATFAELWETLARDKADALSLNLDRKSLIITSFARLETASRG